MSPIIKFICIWMIPAICILLTLVDIIYFINIKKPFNRLIVALNFALLWVYVGYAQRFWECFSGPYAYSLQSVLNNISNNLGASYKETCIALYCGVFGTIVLFHISPIVFDRIIKMKKGNSA